MAQYAVFDLAPASVISNRTQILPCSFDFRDFVNMAESQFLQDFAYIALESHQFPCSLFAILSVS
jgi:hypothetical protein